MTREGRFIMRVIFDDDKVNSLSETGRWLFVALFVFADDRGFINTDESELLPRMMPKHTFRHLNGFKSPSSKLIENFNSYIEEIEKSEMIVRVPHQKSRIFWLKSFKKHQNLHKIVEKCTLLKEDLVFKFIEDRFEQKMVRNSNSNSNSKGEIEIAQLFERFWVVYDYKRNRERALSCWMKLTKADRDFISENDFAVVKAYVKASPEKEFRMNPTTYLNPKNKRWMDEIVVRKNSSTGSGDYGRRKRMAMRG